LAFLKVIAVNSFPIKTRCNDGDDGTGEDVGDLVFPSASGDIVGTGEGSFVGISVGLFDGDTVGNNDCVGGELGQTNGVGLGDMVGYLVGFFDGKSDGLAVGDWIEEEEELNHRINRGSRNEISWNRKKRTSDFSTKSNNQTQTR
jgi:hypothetical protein